MRARPLLAVLLPGLVGLAGCRDQPDGEGAAAALTVPVPPVTQFALLAARSVSIGDRSSVIGGHLGVAAGATNSLTAGADSRAGVGEVLLAPVMTLRDRTIAGELGANQITVGANVTTGPRSAYVAPPAAPALPVFTAGSNAVTVNAGQTQTLAAGGPRGCRGRAGACPGGARRSGRSTERSGQRAPGL